MTQCSKSILNFISRVFIYIYIKIQKWNQNVFFMSCAQPFATFVSKKSRENPVSIIFWSPFIMGQKDSAWVYNKKCKTYVIGSSSHNGNRCVLSGYSVLEQVTTWSLISCSGLEHWLNAEKCKCERRRIDLMEITVSIQSHVARHWGTSQGPFGLSERNNETFIG